MGNTLVHTQLEDVKSLLENAVNEFETFLNQITLTSLVQEKAGDTDYYRTLLSSLRKLVVYCEEGLSSCQVILQNDHFAKAAAEKILYRIYHQCIEEFFSPSSDVWYEDSRSAYTGKNSIKFRQDVPDNVKAVFQNLESPFQQLREELEYYETDYLTKMMQSK